ncbi:MAG: dihydroorotate dehydrogenase [Lentisphaeria bacterium]|nr:dihydroorotate dehydrogenase [Lentisphaeria bacterium]
MADLSVNLAGLRLRNPLITASGAFGYGSEYLDLLPFEQLGAITVKGVSPFPSDGNPTPRTAEVYGGMLNAIGLQNPGLQKFIAEPQYLPFLRTLPCPVIVNIWGRSIEQYAEVAAGLEAEQRGIAALEINISCPNIKEGGIAFGTDLRLAAKVVSAVRQVSSLPLITKLSPNVSSIGDFAKCVVEAGSDMVSLINTMPGMAIDLESRRPLLANVSGGYSGPGLKPIALRMVYEARKAIKAPIIGMGGISNARDALEFIVAGADAVAVGTAIFANPQCLIDIPREMNEWLEQQGIKQISEICNSLKT